MPRMSCKLSRKFKLELFVHFSPRANELVKSFGKIRSNNAEKLPNNALAEFAPIIQRFFLLV